MKTNPFVFPLSGKLLKFRSFQLAVFALAAQLAFAADYYCDPVTGSMTNDGSVSSPWGSLEAVFSNGKTFAAGDVIHLRGGFHGSPVISGKNDGYVRIQAVQGETPEAATVTFTDAARWVLSGLEISPELGGYYNNNTGTQVLGIGSTSSWITVRDCSIFGAEDVYSWTADQVLARLGVGVRVRGLNCTIENNEIRNHRYSVVGEYQAEGLLVRGNLIEGILEDAIRALANYSTYENNLIRTYYGINDAHDDMIQSWSGGHDGIAVGTSTVYGVILRGNVGINQVDPSNPFPDIYGVQGLGLFDGFFENWVLENNIIVTDMYHGISFFGAINCRIVNNTVAQNPVHPSNRVPWLAIYNHKNGQPSSGNIVRNNFVSRIGQEGATGNNPPMVGATLANNRTISSYEANFVDYAGYDFHLKEGSFAVNSGASAFAPTVDFEGQERQGTIDVGADELGSTVSSNQPPVLLLPDPENLFEESSKVVPLTASDPDNSVFLFTAEGLPDFATLSDHGDNSASLDLNPRAGDAGTYSVRIIVSDGVYTDRRIYRFNVISSETGDATLVGKWDFDNDATDSSGSGNDGSLSGDAAFSTDRVRGSHALSLDGSEDYVTIPDSESLRITGDISLAGYVKPRQIGSSQNLISKSFNDGYRLRIHTNGQLQLVLGIPGSGAHTVVGAIGGSILKVGEWQHFAVTVSFNASTGQVRFYNNFELVDTVGIAIAGIEDGSGALTLGAGGGEDLDGLLDEVRIYDGALTDYEVSLLGARTWAGLPVNSSGFVDTAGWMGPLYPLSGSDWVFSPALGNFLFLPEPADISSGAWAFVTASQ